MKLPDASALPETGAVNKEQVAAWLGITTRSVDRLVAQGLIRKIKIGSCTRFNAAEIRNMIH